MRKKIRQKDISDRAEDIEDRLGDIALAIQDLRIERTALEIELALLRSKCSHKTQLLEGPLFFGNRCKKCGLTVHVKPD